MSSNVFKCFDASGFAGLTYNQKNEYSMAWNTFNRVQLFDSNVSTVRAAGNTTIQYYRFPTNSERYLFTEGRSLHLKTLPALSSFWAPIR
jgi:hypothetical protein